MDRAGKRIAATLGIVAGLGLSLACPLVWLQETSPDVTLASSLDSSVDVSEANPDSSMSGLLVASSYASYASGSAGDASGSTDDSSGFVGNAAIYVRSAVPLPAANHPRPTRIALSVIGISTVIVPVSTVATGSVDVVVPPTDIHTIGWLDSSAPADSKSGATVLVGHRDSWAQGEGALFNVNEIPAGSVVKLALSNGTVQMYKVVKRRHYGEKSLPADLLLSTGGPHRLVLITCGGDLDPLTAHYEDNVVVTAVPITTKP